MSNLMLDSRMKAAKCPKEELSLTDWAFVNPEDFNDSVKHIEVSTSPEQCFVFTVKSHKDVLQSTIGFNKLQRKWATLSIGQEIDVRPFKFDINTQTLATINLEVDLYDKKRTTRKPYDSDAIAREFSAKFHHHGFAVGQQLVFQFQELPLLIIIVKELEGADINAIKSGVSSAKSRELRIGQYFPNTMIVFDKSEGSSVNLVGKSKGKTVHHSIINPDWDFQNMGVGGLDTEFSAIFRRAFASRVFPPEIVEQLGCKHVKGILLYGPPGTGKTLIARQIAKMLNTREPKIVNGPEILNKYVGESEANVRRLFAEAEEEEKRLGPNSALHIIIFDEIDAICKSRGSVAGASGVNDTVLTQLLAKIDGVGQLNNILVIGMTNRRDLIDEALLRPGRMEVQMEIGLPSETGRFQIFIIHTARMRDNKRMAADVDLQELAVLTKNFSGAEIEGLVRAAQSTALSRFIKASNKVEIDPEAGEKLMVDRGHFLHALENDIKPAFGTSSEALELYITRGIINWGEPIRSLLDDGAILTQKARSGFGLVSVLLEGPPNAGKTALAAQLAKNSDFPFIKICSPHDMIGFSESAKVLQIRKFFDDAYRSELSCILVDNIERLLDYGAIGPRYSNLVLQALLLLLTNQPPKGQKLLVICTTSRRQLLEELEILSTFTKILRVPNISTSEQLIAVLEETDVFSKSQIAAIAQKVANKRLFIGIKKLLEMIEIAEKYDEEHRVLYFLKDLEEEDLLFDA
ncbi:vesicle-fusing ATPase 1-like [Daphnia pulex]|uniref:vesicle-fusing ATPase 1-like n=1 Tax=Daphnia pulex TaxID=6669 RepID=UPI001EDCFF51|nr:vesicle-fusing ATPase 1-like [Daphnia pulex]XP_046439783.1 vesicle-fusing ATPase 1-like [Daphnia pulex]XP_046439784.1 vesicle-fusing ATPase 1-like [Daphnia pulex]XP_046439785.1 vesicle-fusing ATPase 1-like [Daphnia pulex]